MPKSDVHAKRRQRRKTVARVFSLFGGCVLLPLFVVMIWTGYLTWVGITVGIVYLAPGIISPVAGLTGRKRLEGLLSWLSIGMPIVAGLVVAVILALPKRDSTGWRPYSFDAELATLEARRAIPDDENAALRYDAVLATVDIDNRPGFLFDGQDLRNEFSKQPWKGEDHPQASAWLNSHTETVTELLKIGQMKQCRWPICVKANFQWTVPHKKLRYGTQLLVAEGNRHLGENRVDSALKVGICLLGCADHLHQQTHAVDLLGTFSFEEKGFEILRRLLAASDLSAEDIDRIAEHLPDPANAWRQDIERLLEFDELRFAQFMAPVYEINEQGQTRFATWFPLLLEGPDRAEYARLAKLAPLYYHLNMPADPKGLWPMAEQECARIARLLESDLTSPISMEKLDPFGNIVTMLARLGANWARYAGRTTCLDTFLYASFQRNYAEHLTQRRGTWLVLGLRKYRDQHGQWPESLDKISEYVPEEASVDPVNGGHFVYVPDGESFGLYSVGVNGIDEGGRDRYNRESDTIEDDIAIGPPRSLRSESKHQDVNDV